MQEIRKLLRDDQWKRLEPLLPGKAGDRGATGRDNRLFLEAVLWIVRAGLRGETCLRHWGTGTPHTRASNAGAKSLRRRFVPALCS
jgi:transposase